MKNVSPTPALAVCELIVVIRHKYTIYFFDFFCKLYFIQKHLKT